MTTRSTQGCIALALFIALSALIPIAAVASEPKLTYPTGTVLETGKSIRATSIGEPVLTSSEGNVTCSSATMAGNLTKNSAGSVEATIESASFNSGKHCGSGAEADVSPSAPLCLRSTPEMKTDEFQIRGGACGKAITSIRLVVKRMVFARECVYERAEPITGSYLTDPSGAVLSSMNTLSRVAGHFILCPSSLTFDTSYAFETLGGSSLLISSGPSLTGLSAGTEVRGQSSAQFTGVFGINTTCPSSELTGTLSKNSGSAIEVDIEGASISGGALLGTCPWPESGSLGYQKFTFNGEKNGLPWCLRATSEMEADQYQIRGGSCASEARPIRFSYDTYEPVSCIYEREAALAGTYQTHPKDAVLNFEEAVFLEVEKKAACPDQTQLDSSMTLERDTEGSQPVYID